MTKSTYSKLLKQKEVAKKPMDEKDMMTKPVKKGASSYSGMLKGEK